MPLGVFPPSSPPTFPTPENVFDGIVKTSSDYVMTAPAMVEVSNQVPTMRKASKMGIVAMGTGSDEGPAYEDHERHCESTI